MRKRILSFKEYLDVSRAIDVEIREVFTMLSEIHPFYKTHKTVKEILEHQDRHISRSDLLTVQRDTVAFIVKISPKRRNPVTERDLHTIAEMTALESAAALLPSLLAAKLQATLPQQLLS